MGAGGKMEAAKVKVADINSTRIACKTIRRRLKHKIDKLKWFSVQIENSLK
jgi:tRNA A37 threonylcarbamoyladenosine dehydratase